MTSVLELIWNQRLGHKKAKLNICHYMLTSSTQMQNRSFHVVERTRTSAKCQKMKYARAKRAKILFFIVKYANLPSSSWLLRLSAVLGRPVELCMDESANFKVHLPEKLSKLQVSSIIKTLKVKHSVYFWRTQSFSSFRIHVIIASFLLASANSLQMFFRNSFFVGFEIFHFRKYRGAAFERKLVLWRICWSIHTKKWQRWGEEFNWSIGGLQPTSRDTDNNAAMYNCWWTNKRS